jgi:hypothetical protein
VHHVRILGAGRKPHICFLTDGPGVVPNRSRARTSAPLVTGAGRFVKRLHSHAEPAAE